jgi:hypothetical protein
MARDRAPDRSHPMIRKLVPLLFAAVCTLLTVASASATITWGD